MKIYLLLITFLFSINILLRSQNTYELFSIPGLKFGIAYLDSHENYKMSNSSLFYEGDTLIDEKRFLLYTRNTYPLSKSLIFIEGFKVYFLYNGNPTMQLIYDFGAEPGDKLTEIPDQPTVIDKKIIRLSDGKDRIYMKLSLTPQYIVEWIEGIGDIRDSFLSSIHIHGEDLELVCVSAGDQIIFEKNVNNINCDSLICISSASKFSFTESGNEVKFINESVYAEKVRWDFGDGNF